MGFVEKGIEKLSLPNDVMRLVLGRIELLGNQAKELLSVGALIGNHFGLSMVANVCKVSLGTAGAAVAEALRAHLVERVGEGEYAFVHDRVQEALLSEIPSQDVIHFHRRIAEVMLSQPRLGDDYVFALARHLNSGAPLERSKESFTCEL